MTMTITEIIERAGGRKDVADACELSQDAIRKWPQIGVPDRYWGTLMRLSGGAFGPNEIFEANTLARGASSGIQGGALAEAS